MKVFIDTNILIDYFAPRTEFYENAKRVINCCITRIDGCIASLSIPNLVYTLKKGHNLNDEKCREMIDKIISVFEISDLNKFILESANKDLTFSDFEDSIQNQCAISSDVNYIITRNTKDFTGTPDSIEVMQPKDFLEEFEF